MFSFMSTAHSNTLGSHVFMFCGSLNKSAPHRLIPKSGIFERIRRIKRCGLVRENVSLGVGFDVSKSHLRPRLSLSLLTDHNVSLSYCSSTCLSAAMLPTTIVD